MVTVVRGEVGHGYRRPFLRFFRNILSNDQFEQYQNVNIVTV